MPGVEWSDADLVEAFRKYDPVSIEGVENGVRVEWRSDPQVGSAPQKRADEMGYYVGPIQPTDSGTVIVEYRPRNRVK